MRDKSIELLKVRGEDNPADLFAKHLVGRDRIHELLRLLGCHYRVGRAGAAPQLREGAGTSKGELLNVEGHDCEKLLWDGHLFPCTVEDGVKVPEAYPAVPGRLPHLHYDLGRRFPRARAAGEIDDPDPPEHEGLERRGEALGRAMVRYRKDDSVVEPD